MAEAFARHYFPADIEAHSAGTQPHGPNRLAMKVLADVGVEVSFARSKHVDELLAIPFDLVVTVCGNADQVCPTFPGAGRRVHVPFDDPPKLAAGAKSDDEALPHYVRVRDEIRDFVRDRLQGLIRD
jgi:arsenate reductase